MRQPLIFYPGDTYSNADELLNVVLSYQQNFVSHQGNNNAKPDQIFFANLLVTCAFTFLDYLRAKPKFVQKRSFYCGFFFKKGGSAINVINLISFISEVQQSAKKMSLKHNNL